MLQHTLTQQLLIATALTLSLSACSPNSEPVKIAEPQREALDQAKETATNIEQAATEAKKNIDEQTQ